MRTLEELDAEIADVRRSLGEVRGSETEIYTRIVGYYRSLRNWNKGKKEEYRERRSFDPNLSAPAGQRPAAAPVPTRQPQAVADVSSYSYFFRASCPNCPPVAELVNRLPLSGAAVDVDSEEGLAAALAVGVLSTPTVVFYDQAGRSVYQGQSVAGIQDFFSHACSL